MNRGNEVFQALQSRARSTADKFGGHAPTQEYLIRHLLESFLDRLNRTEHGKDFVLKGGVLLAAYGVRRPTKDADANAVGTDVSPDNLIKILQEISEMEIADGVIFDLTTLTIQKIREQANYPGLRARVKANIGPWQGTAVWDVSAGDPIVSARMVTIERVLGDPITLLGYTAEATIAEKGVTILERGITSTRWRDYVDIVMLCRQGFDPEELRKSAKAIAQYRGVHLEPVETHLKGYAAIGQSKWAAWRRKERLEEISEANLDDQIALVANYLDPVFRSDF